MFLDLLYSYQDLCERHERGVLHDHQSALAKMRQYKKKKMGATIQGPGEVQLIVLFSLQLKELFQSPTLFNDASLHYVVYRNRVENVEYTFISHF